ncbi:MAG: hypothetical protein KatS3mg060_1190 [Dehalococcoidia bacterium]|nr:MAG: hypothetical protein KatS3mg060_1190 [Dehalococcoidia bacterium]
MSDRRPSAIGWRALQRAQARESARSVIGLSWFCAGAAWGVAVGIIVAGLLR